MIGRLTGKVVEDAADGTIVVDVVGVGYEVSVPLGALGRAPVDERGDVTLFVHTHAREDALLLYGFPSRDDRAAFRQLIAVSNVGPKIAMSILGAMSARELADALARGEVKRLVAIPGVGKKTAERLVLELKGKIQIAGGAGASPTAQLPTPAAAPRGDKAELLHSALTRLGYRPSEADRALASLGPRVLEAPLSDLVREALAVLSS